MNKYIKEARESLGDLILSTCNYRDSLNPETQRCEIFFINMLLDDLYTVNGKLTVSVVQ